MSNLRLGVDDNERCVPRALIELREAALAHALTQYPAELLPVDAVDDEVDGRVKHLERVAQLHDDEAERAALLHAILPQQLHDPGRRVAHNEHDDDDNHDERDVLVADLTHRPSAAPQNGLVGEHQLGAEDREQEERQSEAEDVIEDVEVDEPVDPTATQWRRPEHVAGRAVW